MQQDLKIRVARLSDAEAMLRIYTPYVTDTAVSFEYQVPSADEFRARMSRVLERFPWLTAERGGSVVGYVYVSPFKSRPAYDWAVETSIYVRQDQHGSGVGRALYEALEAALRAQGVLNVNACIAYPAETDEYVTDASARFHEHMGYRRVGEFHACGYKFHRWYNMLWMEKHIGTHLAEQPPVRPFRTVADELCRSGVLAGN